MNGSVLAKHRAQMLDWTYTLTQAQQCLVDAQVATHPVAKLVPDIACEIAFAHGWQVAERRPSPGAVLLNLAKG